MTIDNKFETPQYVGQGHHGIVFRISNHKAAKFGKTSRMSLISKVSLFGLPLPHEYKICKALFENGVSVPKPHGMFRLKLPRNKYGVIGNIMTFPAFVMEYIDGMDYHQVTKSSERRKIRELYTKELMKVKDLGMQALDLSSDNCIWSRKKEKIYLIDFNQWELTGGN